jgi:hypothetical protein
VIKYEDHISDAGAPEATVRLRLAANHKRLARKSKGPNGACGCAPAYLVLVRGADGDVRRHSLRLHALVGFFIVRVLAIGFELPPSRPSSTRFEVMVEAAG